MAVIVEEHVLVQFQADMAKFKQDLNSIKGQTSKASSEIGSMIKGAISIAGLVAITKEFVKISDEWTSLNNKIKLASDSTEEYNTAQKELFSIAQQTHADILATATLYQRLETSTKNLSLSQQNLFRITETVNKSLVISGAGASEAAATIRQLGQAMASGVLRGDEFNSLMENSPRLSRAMADAMGVTTGELRKMAEEGELTAERVSNAIMSQSDVIDKEFASMDITIEQSMVNMGNSLGKLVNEFNSSVKGNDGLAGTILYFSQLIDDNTKQIAEFFADVFRAFQLMGEGIILVGNSFIMVALDISIAWQKQINIMYKAWNWLTVGIHNLFKAAIDAVGKLAYDGINYVLKQISSFYNTIGKVVGDVYESIGQKNPFQAINLTIGEYKSSIATATMATKDLFDVDYTKSKLAIATETQNTALKAMKVTFDDIMKDTYLDSKNINIKKDPPDDPNNDPAKKIEDVGKAAKDAKDKVKELKDEVKELTHDVATDLASSMTGAIEGWITGMDSFKDMTQNVLQIMIDKFTELAVLKPFENLLTGLFDTGGSFDLTSLIQGWMGNSSGGGSSFDFAGLLSSFTSGFFADGGNVYKSGNYVVGEKGPEIVNLPAGASVTPNHAIGGANVNVNVNNYSNSQVDVQQRGNDIDIIISSIATGIQRGTSPIGGAIESRYGMRKI